MAELDPAVVAKHKAAHAGEVHLLTTKKSGIQVLCKTPGEGEWARFLDERGDPKMKGRALRNLFLSCLLAPDPKEFYQVLGTKPALAEVFANELVEIAGATEEAEAKKA